MGAGASAETKITKSDALMAVHEAFHGKGDGELSIQEIVSAAPAPTPKTAPKRRRVVVEDEDEED